MNVLSIQSWVTYGHVGNAAATFPLQRLGTEVWAVHTVQFSNHPGHGDFAGRTAPAPEIAAIVAALDRRGTLAHCDAVLSGYLGDPAIAEAIADAVARVRRANTAALYCCDPVIGDAGRVYVKDTIPQAIAGRLLPEADIATPNQFELATLTGAPCTTLAQVRTAAAALHARLRPSPKRTVLVTSLAVAETPPDALDIVTVDDAGAARIRVPRLEVAASGAGDTMAALFLHHRLAGLTAPAAMARAAASLHGILRATADAGADELALIPAQSELAAPTLQPEIQLL